MHIQRPDTSSARSIYALPDDVLLLVVSHINIKDIISLRMTSKKFYDLTKLRWVWTDAVKRHVSKGLPVPAAQASLKALSAEHLESRAVHAAKFNENWYSSNPRPRGAIEFQVSTTTMAPTTGMPDEAELIPAAVRKVQFMSGRSGEFLVILVEKTIECWEVPLDGSGAYRIAEWTDEHGIDQLIVNQDPKHPAEVGYIAPCPVDGQFVWLYTLSLDTFHGKFKARSGIRGLRQNIFPVHLLFGEYAIMGDPLIVWYAASGPGSTKSVTRMINEVQIEDNKILAVKMVDRHVMVVRTKSVEVYSCPVWSATEGKFSSPGQIVSALSMDAEPAREAVIVTHPLANTEILPSTSSSVLSRPVTVLLLQRLEFLGLHTLSQLDFLPHIDPKTSGSSQAAPLKLPVECTRVFQIAPSSCHLQASSSGKGFWVQTGNVTSRHAQYPARCIMGFDVIPQSQEAPHTSRKKHDSEITLLRTSVGLEDAPTVNLCKSHVYARRCDMSEILRKNYSLRTVDMDDTIGRIVVGDRKGKIQVLDYV